MKDDFVATLKYIALEKDDSKTYSEYFLSLLLDIGSDIDVLGHVIARLYREDFNMKNHWDKTFETIKKNFPEILDVEVNVKRSDIKNKP